MNARNGTKYIITLMLIFLTAGAAGAYTSTVFEIPSTGGKEQHYNYSNNIATEVKLLDSDDGITKIIINVDPSDNDVNGVTVNISSKVTYTTLSQKNYWFGIPYRTITHYLTIAGTGAEENYTYFNQSINQMELTSCGIRSEILYDTGTGKTTFNSDTNLCGFRLYSWRLSNETSLSTGMPSGDIILTGLSPFSFEIKVVNLPTENERENEVSSLSTVSYAIYWGLDKIWQIVTLGQGGHLEAIIPILKTIDWTIFLIKVFALSVYTYPILILFWLLSIGNIYSGYMAATPKDVIRNEARYWRFVGGGFYKLGMSAIQAGMWVLRIIRG